VVIRNIEVSISKCKQIKMRKEQKMPRAASASMCKSVILSAGVPHSPLLVLVADKRAPIALAMLVFSLLPSVWTLNLTELLVEPSTRVGSIHRCESPIVKFESHIVNILIMEVL